MKSEIVTGCLITALIFLTGCANQENNLVDRDASNTMVPQNYSASQANVQLGLGYLQQGQRDRAKSKLISALQEAPHSAQANDAMAYFHETTGELDKANEFYKRALSYSPTKGAPLNNYGAFLCRRGQYLEAERYFISAVKDPNYISVADAYENAGLCTQRIPDDAKAKYYFTAALKNDPKRPTSLIELGQINYRESNFKEADNYLKEYAKLARPTAESSLLTYRVATKLRQFSRAAAARMLLQSQFSQSNEYKQYLASKGKKRV